jgi:hypothetical protein
MVCLGVLAPVGLFVVGSGTAWAGVNAVGSASCNAIQTGSGTVAPGLSVSGASGSAVKITFTAIYSGCTSAVTTPAGDHVVGAKVKGAGTYVPVPAPGNPSSCTNFATTDEVGTITVRIKWIMSGAPINPTVIVYKNLVNTVAAGPSYDTITLAHHMAPAADAVKSGSFAVPQNTLAKDTTQIVTTLPSPSGACPAAPSPMLSFTISGGLVAM